MDILGWLERPGGVHTFENGCPECLELYKKGLGF